MNLLICVSLATLRIVQQQKHLQRSKISISCAPSKWSWPLESILLKSARKYNVAALRHTHQACRAKKSLEIISRQCATLSLPCTRTFEKGINLYTVIGTLINSFLLFSHFQQSWYEIVQDKRANNGRCLTKQNYFLFRLLEPSKVYNCWYDKTWIGDRRTSLKGFGWIALIFKIFPVIFCELSIKRFFKNLTMNSFYFVKKTNF